MSEFREGTQQTGTQISADGARTSYCWHPQGRANKADSADVRKTAQLDSATATRRKCLCYSEEVCWGNIHKKYNQTGNPQDSHSQEKTMCSSFSFAVSIRSVLISGSNWKSNIVIFRVLVPGSYMLKVTKATTPRSNARRSETGHLPTLLNKIKLFSRSKKKKFGVEIQ